MTPDQRFTLLLTVISVFVIPTLALVIRATIKWTKVESKLEEISADLISIVRDKDKTHDEMFRQMREDRAATDRRLRWLEEHLWKNRQS